MPTINDHIADLIIKHLQETITADETQTLEQWVAASDDNKAKFNRLTNGESLSEDLMAHSLSDQQIQDLVYSELPEVKDALTVIVTPKRNWMRWASVAAAVLVIAFAGIWLLRSKETTTTNGAEQQVPVATDIPPGGNKATLTLADGSVVVLDTFSNKRLVQQGRTNVYTKEGKLVYEEKGKHNEALYNTLTTAKGEMFGMTMSDGSKIWLNSQSSIRYPVSFNGDKRNVEITGEAYFEVAALSQKLPFIVSLNGMEVEVLGTHFNISSYTNEPAKKTTLLEGKVRVRSTANNAQIILEPGEQAILKKSQDDKTILGKTKDVDVEAEVAWRFGYFQFVNADLRTVMHQLERWYDVEVVYESNVHNDLELLGKIPRSMNLSRVLEVLQSQQVHFKLEGHKIIVLP